MRITVVENDTYVLDTVKYMLEEEGFEVACFNNINSYKDIVNSFPDLILLDHWLGEMTGRELAAAIKADNQSKHIPILFISAVDNVERVTKLCAANGFIAKPFDFEKLITTVKKHTDSIQLRYEHHDNFNGISRQATGY